MSDEEKGKPATIRPGYAWDPVQKRVRAINPKTGRFYTTLELTALAAERCKTDLKYLCIYSLWANQPDDRKLWSKCHDDLAEFLKRPSKRKLILIPRGHLKSSIVTKGWAVQQVLSNPDLRVLLANAVWDNSRKFLRSIEKYMGAGSVLESYFRLRFETTHWNQDECTISTRKQILDAPTFATTGIEKEQTSQHYDLIIADDLVARENVTTHEQREKVKTYYQDLLDLLEPSGTLVVIGTRWHQNDLYQKILDEEKETPGTWDIFLRTCYADETRSQALFPEKFSLVGLDQLRRSKGAYHFAGQYLNNPIDESAADFRSEWIKYFEPGTPHPGSLYLTVDPAISLSRDADYSALVVAGQYSDRRIRVVDRVHRRMVPSDLVDAIFELVKKWNLHRIGVETFAFQKTLKYDIQLQQRQRGVFFSIDELGKRHSGRGEQPVSKEARIRRLQPYFEQGLIEIRTDMQDLVDELLSFPRGRYDDLIDALSYQLDYMVPSMGVVKDESPKWDGTFKTSTMGWWLNQMPEKELSIYDRFMQNGMR